MVKPENTSLISFHCMSKQKKQLFITSYHENHVSLNLTGQEHHIEHTLHFHPCNTHNLDRDQSTAGLKV